MPTYTITIATHDPYDVGVAVQNAIEAYEADSGVEPTVKDGDPYTLVTLDGTVYRGTLSATYKVAPQSD